MKRMKEKYRQKIDEKIEENNVLVVLGLGKKKVNEKGKKKVEKIKF